VIHTLSLQQNYLRPLDVRKDLLSVAELIELCFSNQMDPEGREYVRQIRQAGRDARYIRWIPGAHERISFPLYGYVWEQNNRIIGNLSLIPFYRGGVWRYLIANVAVHPDYRRQGIGRYLTEKALEHIQEQNVPAAWLQVRADNEAAYNLYRQLGFVERARRSTWQSSTNSTFTLPPTSSALQITNRTSSDWSLQQNWLQENYPPAVSWNLPIQIQYLGPGVVPWLQRFFTGHPVQHWAARRSGKLVGTVTWEQSPLYIDHLWLATAQQDEEEAVQALLMHARKRLQYRRQLSVNYPADRATSAFERSGFQLHNTLAWMVVEFS
jgi:ribosomal protein S18 acetylase RimI-like enzyme